MWTRLGFCVFLLMTVAACELASSPEPAADKALPVALDHHRILFMHRSVGGNLVRNGEPDMYDTLAALNLEHGTSNQLWHLFCGAGPYWNRYYDQNDQQVVPNFGVALERSNGAAPDHWRQVFCDPAPEYVAARDSIADFRVIAFKSGYDNTVAQATTRIGQWRDDYNAMKDSEFFRDPRRRIVVMGFPPLREGLGGAEQADADSARAFCDWLAEEWSRGRGNLHVFPLFDLLAGEDNWLRDEYELAVPNDSHPNQLGSTVVGGALMTFLYGVANTSAAVAPPADTADRVRALDR
ncbi:MAG: hypothetical protein R3D98_06835 [Candidatus Krumholzibacteriia bacterium]